MGRCVRPQESAAAGGVLGGEVANAVRFVNVGSARWAVVVGIALVVVEDMVVVVAVVVVEVVKGVVVGGPGDEPIVIV